MNRLLFACLASTLLAPSAYAQRWKSLFPDKGISASAACARKAPVAVGGTQAYAGANGGLCFVDVHPLDDNGMVYRDYAFFGDGMLMVFSSYGAGEDPARYTSAREFSFFPRSRGLDLTADPKAPTVSVAMTNGDRAAFNPADAQLRSVGRGGVTVSPRVDPSERGGVEFPSYNGLMLDAGFRMGELPSMKPDGQAVFRSAYGQTCAVKNSEVYAYHGRDRTFKFADAELSLWLKTRCPGLYVDF